MTANPVGDENSILILFGLTAVVVLLIAIRAGGSPRSMSLVSLAGLACGAAVYACLALLALVVHGTGGYTLSTWLVLAGVGGLIPAALIGLVEGVLAGLIFRLFARFAR